MKTWSNFHWAFLLQEKSLTTLNEQRSQLSNNSENLSEQLVAVKKKIKKISKELKLIIDTHLQDKWPDLIVETLAGSIPTSIYRSNPKHYMFSQTRHSQGKLCGKRHNIVFKSSACMHSCSSCGCVTTVGDANIWIGTVHEKSEWIPEGCRKTHNGRLETVINSTFKCNVYVHQAKITSANVRKCQVNTKVVVTLNALQGMTKVVGSWSPVWNETISFDGVTLNRSPDSVKCFPPSLTVDVINVDAKVSLC